MGFPIFPTWLSPTILMLGVALLAIYVVLSVRTKTERCTHCGKVNPIEAMRCAHCGESTFIYRVGWFASLGAVGMILGFVPLILLVLSAQNYPDPPVNELIASGVGLGVFVLGFILLMVMPRNRIRLKQKAMILHPSFYGGYCAKCGTEMLGGWAKCPKCGWKVNADKPNWAIASKNGKAGLPVVDLKITCYKCKAENAVSALKCKKCHADLLAYKPVWLRVTYFVVCVLFSLGTGWVVMRAFQDPDVFEGLDAIGFGVISLTLITIVMPFYGFYLALGRGKLPELLAERADRHLTQNPWQALEDFGHALELAPVHEHAQVMTNRMKLYRTLGLEQNATREELAITYARENNPQGGFGLFMAGNIFGDSFTTGFLRGAAKNARKDREKMYAEGRAIIVGYCPVCKEAVELTTDFRCPNAEKAGAPKHHGKPKILQYVIPADVEAGKAAVLRAEEMSRKRLRGRFVSIVLAIIGIAALCSIINYIMNM